MITLNRDPFTPIREDLYGALERYLNHGIPPGGFLTAVLQNDLKGAFARADSTNTANMKNIVGYMYNNFPSGCWGSREKVQAHFNSFKKEE